MRDKFVREAGQFYKTYSFWGILILGVLPFLEEYSADIVGVVPVSYQSSTSLILALVIAVLRFVKQPNIER